MGSYFAYKCSNLYKVDYEGITKGTNIVNNGLGYFCFAHSNTDGLKRSGILDDDGIMTLGNWLLDIPIDIDTKELKISEFSKNGVPIDGVGPTACRRLKYVENVDLDGIKYIASKSFENSPNLKCFINCDDLIFADNSAFTSTPWYDEAMERTYVRLGNTLIYYKTESDTLDLLSGELKGVKCVCSDALKDSENIKIVLCDHDCTFLEGCFYKTHELHQFEHHCPDPMPLYSVYNIEEVYLDGKKVTYSRLINDSYAYSWFKRNQLAFDDSEFTKEMVTEKTKELFKQMGIEYYGENNDVIGTLTPTEEFYIRLKIFNYISIYDYDHNNEFKGLEGAFLLGGKYTCTTYAEMTHYLLNCAGVEAKTLFVNPESPGVHFWNATKIGNEWFESDDGWSAQGNNHSYGWLLLSATAIMTDDHHEFQVSYDTYHLDVETEKYEPIIANRIVGDINGDDDRDQKDVDMLWAYIKNESLSIPTKPADINFDKKIDVKDAVLLENFVNGKAIDLNNVPSDGFAPSVHIAFLNGTDYDNIKYLYTDREGYITLPDDLFEAPAGKKISYDVGRAGEKVRLTDPLTVVRVKWVDENEPDHSEPESSSSESSKQDNSRPDDDRSKPGDVNNDSIIDIEDAVAIIQHINGLTPLNIEEERRADVSNDGNIDIDDAVLLISYINGNTTF